MENVGKAQEAGAEPDLFEHLNARLARDYKEQTGKDRIRRTRDAADLDTLPELFPRTNAYPNQIARDFAEYRRKIDDLD